MTKLQKLMNGRYVDFKTFPTLSEARAYQRDNNRWMPYYKVAGDLTRKQAVESQYTRPSACDCEQTTEYHKATCGVFD